MKKDKKRRNMQAESKIPAWPLIFYNNVVLIHVKQKKAKPGYLIFSYFPNETWFVLIFF